MLLVVLTIIPVILLLGTFWWYQTFSHVGKHLKRIPGPGVPILGVFLQYLTRDRAILFQNDRNRSSVYNPIYKMWAFHKSTVILQHPEDIEILLSSTRHITKSMIYQIFEIWLGTGLLTSAGEKWKLRRKMLTPAFHFTILKGFIEVFNEATEKLVNNFKERLNDDYIEIDPQVTDFTLKSMAETLMGCSLGTESNAYKQATFDFAELMVERVVKPWLTDDHLFRIFPASLKADRILKVLHGFTRNIIKERKKTFQGSLYTSVKRLAMLDLLLKAQELDGSIDDEGIREEVDTFMLEGHDTTGSAICHLLMLLANNPRAQNEARQEILDILGESNPPTYEDLLNLPYSERCIKECLRLYPSVVFIGRNINEDFKTATGYTVPKGTMAHILIYDLHRNPEFYPDPETFDPDRFLPENTQKRHPFAYIPFSAGSRNCIGQKFALLELKAVLCGILREFILEPIDKPGDLVFQTDLVLRSKNPIRIKFVERRK